MSTVNMLNTIYVINKSNFIYEIVSFEQMSNQCLCYNLELVAGYDYINPDENNIQGFVESEGFTDDVQSESFTVYLLSESLGERIEDEGYKIIDINKYKIHPFLDKK